MTTNQGETAWMESASQHALELLATLATDDPEAVAERPQVFDRLMLELDDPAKFHTMLYVLVWIAHCMRTTASGDTEPGIWTFQIQGPLGVVPIDQAEPSVRWVSRWLIACMNGDARSAADLWFGTVTSREEARDASKVLTSTLIPFLSHSVREFLRAGRPLVLQAEVD